VVGYLIRRIGQAIIVLFIVTVFTLALVHLFPGGPIRAMLGPRATVAQVNYYNRLYGFDQPFYVQYIKWVGQILQGNWGFSAKLNISVDRPLCSSGWARSSPWPSGYRSGCTRRCIGTRPVTMC